MNVLEVSKFYYPEYGGLESVVQTAAEGMSARGHDVRVLATVPRGRGHKHTVSGIPVTKTSSLGQFLSVPVAPTFPLRLRTAVRSANIVHYHLPNPLTVTSHFVAQPTASTVATYHSDIIRQSTALRAYQPLLERFLNAIDCLLVTSPRLLEHSSILNQYNKKCRVVPLSVDTSVFGPPGSATESPSEDIDGPILLFVGKLRYYKGIKYLIKSMCRIDATLVIIGEGERRNALETNAQELGVGERVRFLGHISEKKLHAWYDAADLFVLPSVEPSEAFGVVQLEAMAYGTPVINTNLPTGVPWVSKNEETGLTVPPRNPNALAEAISTLLADNERRDAYGQAAYERVCSKFSQNNRINNLKKIFKEL